MAINFQNLVVDPKIDIVGKEVPLAAMEQTGKVLQGRFDQSYADYNKFQELAKQTEQVADPLERQKVKDYINSLKPQVDEIAKKGDFHNMRWQTQALANNAALNLKQFESRAQEAKKYRDLIAANDKLGDEKTKQFYQNKLNQTIAETQYNPETKTFGFTPIQLPKVVEDYDSNKFLQSATQGWLANKYGSESANMSFVNAGESIPGVGGKAAVSGVYNIKSGKQVGGVDFNEVYQNTLKMAQGERGLQAMINRDVEIESEGLNISPEQKAKLKEDITKKYLYNPLTGFANKAAFKQEDYNESLDFDGNATAASGNGKNLETPEFTQLPSAIFNQNKEGNPFKVDEAGNINYNKPSTKGITFVRDEFGIRDKNAANYITDGKLDLNKFENSTEYKRLKTHLTNLGVITKNSNKTNTNLAIVNFWNQLDNAESSIAVAKPGDEKANKYLDEVNKTYFGDRAPDNPATGTSVKTGQLAQRTFTDENGKKLSSQELFGNVKNKNVRVNGWVNQIESPFEYGSHYMVATDPETNETKNYLIEPDINTKNSGAYFANRIFNSTRDKNLKTSWKDGNGVNYEATPLEGGEKFALYIDKDVKTPLILDRNDIKVISQLPAGQANQIIQGYYNSRK